MATKSTVYKVELMVSDIDRNYYATHNLILAQHPSEPDRRLIARLIVFALFADERLVFGRGVSSDDEADLTRLDLTGVIEQWIELGQPDESSIRKACGRSRQVLVVNYSGNSADVWWSKNADSLAKIKNLIVLDLDPGSVDEATRLLQRSMKLSASIQEGELQLSNDTDTIVLTPRTRMP